MPDELKREMAPACLEAPRSPASPSDQVSKPASKSSETAPGTDRPPAEVGWFEAIGRAPDLDTNADVKPPPPRLRRAAAIPLALLALVALTFAKGLLLRFLLPIPLALAATFVIVRATQRVARAPLVGRVRGRGLGLELSEATSAAPPEPEPEREVEQSPSLTDAAIAPAADVLPALPPGRLLFKVPGSTLPQTLLCTSEPFGVTLFSTSRRDRAVAMLTSATGTFCVGASFDADERRRFAPLLDRAFTVTSEETGLDAIGPDGEPILLPPSAFAALIDALLSVDQACLDRLVLTDARGMPLVLDARALRIGDRVIDLEAPLEWRAIVFQEGFGVAIAVYQGTWIRQGTTEVVLVSLLPSLAAAGPASITEGAPLAAQGRSVLRDLRLMQAAPEPPPPTDQRIALERLFMLPMRFALDKAPRPAKQTSRIRA